MTDEEIDWQGRSEKYREWVLRQMGEPPPNCKLKEVVPGMFAWVKLRDNEDDAGCCKSVADKKGEANEASPVIPLIAKRN